jgi:flagellar hook-associated protein 2
MAVAARPRTLLSERNKTLDFERLAVTTLSSLVSAFQFEVNRLASPALFQTKTVSSSDEEVLTATLQSGAKPPAGKYQVRALQAAASQQLLSGGISSLDDLAEEGTLTIGFGGFVDTGIALSELNGGEGVAKGKLRVTDRAGNSAEIDLRAARTVDDVLRAVNNTDAIEVTAIAEGDHIELVDSSGGSGNLRVQEVSGGTTAAGLGLAGIDIAASQASGADVFALHSGTKLSLLNDGNGVELRAGNDLEISLADGTTLQVDLGDAEDLGDVLVALNAANPAKFSAGIAADRNRIELTDLTVGAGTFAATSIGDGAAAEELGLTSVAVGDTITGRRLVSGLRDTLISSLRGGQGLGNLGEIDITNRDAVVSNVDLSAAETLGEIVAAINDQATGVTAAINSARNGIALTDTTGGTASNLIVADGDGNNSATALDLVANIAASAVNSGTLSRQQVGRATLLSSLNQGKGVDLSDFRITDTNGSSATVDMNTLGSEAETLGDVIDRINALAVNVEARINDTGDGILLVDLAGGAGKLEVKELGLGTAAADLRLLGAGIETQIGGNPAVAIDGTSRSIINLSTLDEPGANVLLSSLNASEGVSFGAFRITDSNGSSEAVVISSATGSFKTVADVIDAINATDIAVEARINSSGSGILLFDTAGGTGTLKVEELAGGTTAADLGLDATVKTITVDNQQVQAIDGIGTFTQAIDQSPLGALVARINSLGAGVTASSIFDGDVYRLSLTVDETGAGHELLVDGTAVGLEFTEFSAAQDAVFEVGGTQLGSGVVVSSSTNTFDKIIAGVSLTIAEPSDKTISVEVKVSNAAALDAAEDFVNAYNSVRSNLDEVTSFNADELTTGILFGTSAALRVESDLTRILTGRFFGVGAFNSLEAAGIEFEADGTLSLDKAKFQEAFANDPASLSTLFTHNTFGVSAKLNAAIDALASDDSSALGTRISTLNDQIERNQERITEMDQILERQQEQLLLEFARLESTIAAMRQSLSALASLQIIPPLTRTSGNN